MKRGACTLWLLVGLFGSVPQGWCGSPDEGWKSVGIREGFSATEKSQYFHQYEVFTTYGLPWSLRAKSGWGVALQLEATAGALHAAQETGFVASLGPAFVIDKGGRGLALDVGGAVVEVTKYHFGNHNLNGNPLFQGHFGLTYRFDAGPGIGYRFQHMSNGGFGLHGAGNPGVDLHMFGLSWNFR